MSPGCPDVPAEPERPRVPRALFEGLQLTRRATWTPEAIRAWWAACVTRTDPTMVDFVERSRGLDAVVYGLRDKTHRQKRWDQYCYEVLTPQRLLEPLETCVTAGTLTREEVSRLQEDSLKHVNAKGHWKPPG